MTKQKQKIPTSKKIIALVLATSALAVNFWAWSLLSPLGTRYAAELSLTPTQLSLLLAVPVIMGALGRILLGIVTDKLGGRATFIITCIITIVPVALLAAVGTYEHLLAVAMLLGIGGAAFVVGVPYLSAWFAPAQRGLVLGIYSMGNAGTALSGFATPQLAETIGRPQTYMLVAGLLAVMAILFMVVGRNAPGWKPPVGSSFGRLKQAVKFRPTWDLAAVYAITFGAFVAFGVYLPVLLAVAYDLPATDAAARAAGFVLLATIARPVGGWLSDRIGGKHVVRLALLAVVVLAGFVAFQATLELHTTAAYLSLAFILGCANGAVLAMIGRLAKPEIMGGVTGLIGAIGGLGGFLPPLVLGVTYQYSQSYAPALIMLSVSAFIVLIYVQRRFRDKQMYRPIDVYRR